MRGMQKYWMSAFTGGNSRITAPRTLADLGLHLSSASLPCCLLQLRCWVTTVFLESERESGEISGKGWRVKQPYRLSEILPEKPGLATL